jgi:hypothetical protein
MVRLEGIRKLKGSATSSRLEPATFRLVAQRLNHLLYSVLTRISKPNQLGQMLSQFHPPPTFTTSIMIHPCILFSLQSASSLTKIMHSFLSFTYQNFFVCVFMANAVQLQKFRLSGFHGDQISHDGTENFTIS